MAISDLSTVSAGRPRAFVCNRGADAKVFSITTRIAATVLLALGAIAAIPANNAQAQVTITVTETGTTTGTVNETAGEVEITVRLTAPAAQTITLPITIGGTATPLIRGNGDDDNGTGLFFPDNADYALIYSDCAQAEDYCATGDELVFNANDREKILTLRARADGSAGENTDETVIVTLDAVTSGGITVPANTSATVTIESPDFDLVSPTNRRLEIGGASGSVTLRIRDFEFPADSEDGDILVVPVTVNQLATPDGRSPSPEFPFFSDDARPMNADQGQEISGDFIRLSLPNPRGLTGDKPYFLAQNGSTVRLVVPQALLAENGSTDLSLGTPTVVGAEDIIININAIDNENAETGDFEWSLGVAGGVYPGVSQGQVSRAARRSSFFGSLKPNDDTRIGYSIVRPLADPPLPRTLNPAAQNILEVQGTSTNANFGGVVTVALPAVTAPLNAVSGEIVLDVTDTTATAAAVSALSLTGNTEISITAASGTGTFNLIAPAESRRNTVFAVPGGGVDDLSLSFVATPERTIYGTVAFRVLPRTALADNVSLTFEATGIIFRNSAGNEINAAGTEEAGFQMVVDDTIATGRTATVTKISLVPNSVLGGLKVGEGIVLVEGTVSGGETVEPVLFDGITLRSDQTSDINFLSETGDPADGTGVGAGVAKIPFVAANVGVAVEIERGDPADFTTVGGTNADSGSLTPDDANPVARDRTVMVSGFTPGRNSLTIRVAEASDANPRDYTISVIVAPEPPDPTDSTLASATVDGEDVNLMPNPGTVTIDFTTAATVVATPTHSGADDFLCATSNGEIIDGDAPVSVGPNTLIIYVIAEKAADGATDVVRPTNCTQAQAAVDANDGTATRNDITVTVRPIPNDAADLTELSVSVDGTLNVTPLPTFTPAGEHYGVTITAATAAITATAMHATATISITVAVAPGTSEGPAGAAIALTGGVACTSTTAITSGCGIAGVDAGETALVSIRVAPVSGTPKIYTIAVGPPFARLALNETSLALGAAAELTFQLRNYSLPSTGDFVTARIDTSGDGGGATLGLGAIGANFFESTDYTFALASGGSFEADTTDALSNFRLRVPEALLVAGDNTDENYVNGLDIPITITAKNDDATRVGSTTFALGEVGALDSDGAATGTALNSAVHTNSVDLAVAANTTARLSFPGATTLGTNSATFAESGDAVRARVVIANPNIDSTITDTKITFNMERLASTVTSNVAPTAVTVGADAMITYGTEFTVTADGTGLPASAIVGGIPGVLVSTTAQAGWEIGTDYLKSNSPLEFEMDVTPGADAVANALYTFRIDLVSGSEIDTFRNPSGTGNQANRGKIQIGTFEPTITAGGIVPAVEGGGETASIPVTLTLADIPDDTSIYYRLTLPAADNAHALRDTDYTINCVRTRSPNPETCFDHQAKNTSGGGSLEFDADRDGSIADEAADSTGRFQIRGAGFAGTLSQTIMITIDAATDSVVEGTETVELTLFYLVAGGDTINSGIISVNITDATTSSVTVTPESATTAAEGTSFAVSVSLDTGVTIAENTDFTLALLAPTGGGAEAGAADVTISGAARILATQTVGRGTVFIETDAIDETTNQADIEAFRLGIASIANPTYRTDLPTQLPADTGGVAPHWVPTVDIPITTDLEEASDNALLMALTVAEAVPTVGTARAPTITLTDSSTPGTIDLAADTTAITVFVNPEDDGARVTSITGNQGGTCGTGTALTATPTSGVTGASVTTTISGLDPTGASTNCFEIVVTAQDNMATETYTVIATVLESDDTSLGTLSVGGVPAVMTGSGAYSVPLPGGTTAGTLVIVTTDDDAEIGSLQRGTGTVVLTNPQEDGMNGGAALSLIANGDTITFTVAAEDDNATVVTYTLTIIVQDALLSSVALTPTDEGGTEGTEVVTTSLPGTGPTGSYLGSGDIPRVPANTTGGTLVITPVNLGALGATIFSVTGTNERGGNLMVTDDGAGANGVHTFTLGNMVPGGSELEIIVRPARATDDTTDREYTIGVVAAAANVANSASAGIARTSPMTLPLSGSGSFDVILSGYNTGGRPDVQSGGGRHEVAYAQVTLDFDGGPFTGSVRTWTNDEFEVELPDTGLDQVPVVSGTALQFQIADPSFLADGAIHYPITITPQGTAGFTGNITITNALGCDSGSTCRGTESVSTGFTPETTIRYNVVAGPAVTLVATTPTTIAEATPSVAAELDMTLTRNLDTLNNQRALITYTIGAETGAATLGTDYTLNVGGATAVCAAATGAIAHTCTLGLGGSDTDATFVVTPMDDSVSEDDETVTITITELSFPSGTTPDRDTISFPAAIEVTITDNDANVELGMFSADLISESGASTSASFEVAISNAPAVATTINLILEGTANYGTGLDYTIMTGSADGPPAGTAAANDDPGGTATATVTPDSTGAASVTFYVVAEENSVPDEENQTVIVSLGAITPATTVFRPLNPRAEAARTITINDDDVAVRGFCARTTEVRDLILVAANAVSGNNKTCLSGSEVIPTEAELAAVRTLDLSGIPSTVTILKAGDLADLTGLTSLRLWDLDIIEPGALDPVLPSLTKDDGATGLTNLLDRFVSSVAVDLNHGDGNIQQGRSATIRLTRSNADAAFADADAAFADANVNYTLVGAGGAANGDFTVTPMPETPGTLVFADDEAVKIITITAAPGTNILGSAVFTLTGAAIALAGSEDVSADIIGLGSETVRMLEVTLPAAQPTLSLSEGSIGEKSQDELVVTLNLGTGGNRDYDDATVTFTLSNPAGDETMDPGVPTLVSGTDNPADYTLIVVPDPEEDDLGAINTVVVPAGTSTATFTFKAIDDDRREGNEVLTLAITGVDFMSPDADDPPSNPSAEITITEISGDDVMRETEMITHIVGKEQVNLVTGLVRQRVNALTLGTPQGFSTPGVQVSLAENPETMQDFFSQMALESSGEMDDGGAYAIWGRGQYISISGSPDIAGTDNFEYDGTIGGVGMGIERRFSESLFGLSMNFSSADIDSKSSTRAESNYKETMTFFAPYAAWKPDNSRLTLWGAAGAGFGTAEITGEGHAEGNPSVQAFFAQGGVDISDNIGKTAEVVFGLSAVAIEKTVDGFTAGTLSVPETESSVFQGQADFTAYFPVYSDDGQVLRPYVGLASVHDAGDVLNDDRHAMELQTGIAWSNGPWQVSLDTFYQFLRDDEEAWGIFGEAHWTGRGDLDGLLMGMTSGHGTASSMSDAVSSTDSVNSDIDTNLTNADSETAEWSIQTTTEYGFAAPLLDRNGRATPFFRSTHSADARSFVSGVRMDVTDNIGVTAESNRHIPADDDPYSEHAVGLEARWEF